MKHAWRCVDDESPSRGINIANLDVAARFQARHPCFKIEQYLREIGFERRCGIVAICSHGSGHVHQNLIADRQNDSNTELRRGEVTRNGQNCRDQISDRSK